MQRYLTVWAALVSLAILATSIYGGFHFYSPIPYWDQWDSYVGFYQQVENKPLRALFAQHNEHRIVISKLLFWADIKLLGGNNTLTIVANYLFLAGIGAILWSEWKRGQSMKTSPWLVGALIVGFLFSWTQHENLTWGFQSQCMAVYMFALAAFAQFSRDDNRPLRIAVALFFCVLAEISMGNGLAAFFVMFIQAIMLRRPWRECVTVLVIGITAAALYFVNYQSLSTQTSTHGAEAIIDQAKFVLIFLGAMVRPVSGSLLASGIVGGALFVAAGALTLYSMRNMTPYRSFLIAGYGMIFASALGASRARWMLGLHEAAAPRYTTPVLIGALLIALLAIDCISAARLSRAFAAAFVTLMTWIGTYQVHTFGDSGYLYSRQLAMLGEKIDIRSSEMRGQIYPATDPGRLTAMAKFASQANIGPYASGWLHDAGIVKYDAALRDDARCAGFLESFNAARAVGWVVPRQYENGPTLVVLTDEAGKTVGYGVSGQTRHDVGSTVPAANANAGWVGFVKPGIDKVRAFGYLGRKFCRLGTIDALASGR